MSDDARTILVAGTASHVGKSTVAAGLCRVLSDQGHDVAPFKGQNMSNNAQVVAAPHADGATWGEIGVSQYVQARAARTTPTTDVNPVLLKPRGDAESQLILQGQAVGHYEAGSYYEDHWGDARECAVESHQRLAAENDVIVAEGAGSIAEINLHDRDLANVETARFADADILLVVDIERGGAFAHVVGTLELLPDDIRERVVGTVITKFRGDPSLLDAGIKQVEERTDVPVLGVVPYDDPGLPEEDSVSLESTADSYVVGQDDVPESQTVRIAVPHFPRISNFMDVDPLAQEPGVEVAYVPLDGDLAAADAIVLPGTKNTVDDLLALRAGGLDEEFAAFDGPIVGICGGYQMLGERIENAAVEGTGEAERIQGLGLLPVVTAFSDEKTVERATYSVTAAGPLTGASGEASGYEIHAGETRTAAGTPSPLGPNSAATDRVLGTYLHGLFENEPVRTAFLETVRASAGVSPPERTAATTDSYDRAAQLVANNVDLDALL